MVDRDRHENACGVVMGSLRMRDQFRLGFHDVPIAGCGGRPWPDRYALLTSG